MKQLRVRSSEFISAPEGMIDCLSKNWVSPVDECMSNKKERWSRLGEGYVLKHGT